jgi:WD40 repeat protein
MLGLHPERALALKAKFALKARFAFLAKALTAAAFMGLAGSLPADETKTDNQGDPLPQGARARLGTVRWRHGDTVRFVAFAQDGKAVVTASQDQVIRLWDRATGKEIRRFEGPTAQNPNAPLIAGGGGFGPIGVGQLPLALSPSGKVLAAAFPGGIQLWDVASGEKTRSIKAPVGGVSTLLFSPDGKVLVARAGNRTTYLFEAETGNERGQFKAAKPQGGVVAINFNRTGGASGSAVSQDGKTLATGETDFNQGKVSNCLKLTDMETGKEIRRIDIPDGVSALAYSPDGQILAYASGNSVILAEAASVKEIRKVAAPGGTTVLVFAPDGKWVAAKGRDQVIRLWETETGKEIQHFGQVAAALGGGAVAVLMPFYRPAEARDFAFSPDGKVLAAAAGQTVSFWDVATGKEGPMTGGHRGAVTALAVSPDGKTVLSRGADNVISRWDAATGKKLGQWQAPPTTGTAVFAPDGQSVALGVLDGTVRVVDVASGKELHKLKGHANGTAALAFSPDGKVLGSRGSFDGKIRLFDTVKGHELREISPGGNAAPANPGGFGVVGLRGNGLTFMPDGRTLVAHVAGNPPGFRVVNQPAPAMVSDSLRLFDVAGGKEIRQITLPAVGVAGYAVAPDGRVLAVENADQTITLWEIASGKERGRLGKPAQPTQPGVPIRGGAGLTIAGMPNAASSSVLAYSPDGTLLASKGPGHSVRVWDVLTGEEIGQFKGHAGLVTAVAFAPDGQSLVSGSKDTTLLVWDLARLKRVPTLATLELGPKELEAAWTDLAGDDAAKAFQSILRLARAGGQALPYLSKQLHPAAPVDGKLLERLIADLDSEQFQARQNALSELNKLGELAEPALRKVIAGEPSLETRRRIEPVLEKLASGTLTADRLRLVRALEVLERIGTPDARKLLGALAHGAPGALTTRQSQTILARLSRR